MTNKGQDDVMIYRDLGSTGEKVSLLGIGGWHLGLKYVTEKTALRIVDEALARGVTFFDNCWDYNEGESEKRLGKALKGKRDRVFLMTKIDGRTKKLAAKQIDESLKRLKTDRIDLVQHHEILRFEDPHRIFDPKEGAQLAMLDAQKAGKLRFIGFTGHKDPQIHLHFLETAESYGHKLDTAQMPVNVMDAHYRSFSKLVAPEFNKRKMGILAMKTLANGIILKSKTATPVECLHYAMSQPVSVVVAGIDNLKVLDQAFDAVRTFPDVKKKDIDAILEKTKDAALRGEFEPFKTSSIFDGTAKNPDWIGKEPKRLRSLMP
ncbi:MAG TPA: aldo/keto reductase [Pyrinomonadaceae bacterium]|jgi:aryl-alcohol dehydrogenase-like predicted oxidoreductase